jgi:2'-5' RNA ligase
MPHERLEAVIGLFDDETDAKVRKLWQELEERFGLQSIYATPYPHLSFHTANDYPDEQVEVVLRRVAAEVEPVFVRTSGLGLFTGENPILYLPITRTAELERLHARLFAALEPLAIEPNPHYQPGRWLPHITLASDDLRAHNLPEVIDAISREAFNWCVRIDKLALAYTQEREQGLIAEVALGKAADQR